MTNAPRLETMRASHALAALAAALAITAGIVVFRLEKRRTTLQSQAIALRRQGEESIRLSDATREMQARVAERTAAQTRAQRNLQADVEATRRQIAALESRAQTQHAQKLARTSALAAADAASLADNRDPTRGLTRLEYFCNVGFATPDAAWQTLVWAAMQGDDATLTRGLLLNDAARQRATALFASLPANARTEATPEKLAGLWLTRSLLDVAAAQITEVSFQNASHATLTVRGGITANQKIEMELGPNGWQMIVPEQSIEFVQKKLAAP